MTKKRKLKPLRTASVVKAAARTAIGTPPPTRVEDSRKTRKRKSEKHKSTLSDLLSRPEEE